jgi:hypothetical protein
MEKRSPVSLNPDLVIDQETAIDRMIHIASRSAELRKPTFSKQIQLVRRYARSLCSAYKNCRKEDWCLNCASGNHGSLFLGATCLHCKLLTHDARMENRQKLVRIASSSILTDQSQS